MPLNPQPCKTRDMTINGASGIPIQGREVEYATELWLKGPSAFWLHPEGPLSDKTPEEWKAEQEAKRREVSARYANLGNAYSNAALAQQQSALQQALSQYYKPYMGSGSNYATNFGSIFGRLL